MSSGQQFQSKNFEWAKEIGPTRALHKHLKQINTIIAGLYIQENQVLLLKIWSRHYSTIVKAFQANPKIKIDPH